MTKQTFRSVLETLSSLCEGWDYYVQQPDMKAAEAKKYPGYFRQSNASTLLKEISKAADRIGLAEKELAALTHQGGRQA